MTIEATIEDPTTVQGTLFAMPHVTTLAGTTFRCVQIDCDGLHHFWCDCAHDAPAHAS